MPEAPSALTAWANFYVIVGGAAAALTGLMFVVITLVAGDRRRRSIEGVSTFSTPTVVHFTLALLVSAILSVPWRSLDHAAAALAIAGLFGFVYALRAASGTRRVPEYRPDLEDWLFYAILPCVAHFTIIGAALWLRVAPTLALFPLGGSALLLIFVGIHNAWDIVTYIAIKEPEAKS